MVGNYYPWPSEGGSYTDHIDGSKANYWSSGDPFETGGYPLTTPVGYYDENQNACRRRHGDGYGLYDMAGTSGNGATTGTIRTGTAT